jgi:hypothetical protein
VTDGIAAPANKMIETNKIVANRDIISKERSPPLLLTLCSFAARILNYGKPFVLALNFDSSDFG